MKTKRRLTICLTIAAFGIFAFAVHNSETQAEKFKCSAKGLAVVVGYDHDNTLWSIAHRYCEGNTAAAVDAMYEKYGDVLNPGQIINLP